MTAVGVPELPYCKLIDIDDFDHAGLRTVLLEVAQDEAQRFGLAEPVIVPDSKQWENAMAIKALRDFGVAKAGALIAGIGAGTEATIFRLAADGCVVFPIDRYLDSTPWADVAPAEMLVNPESLTTVPTRRGQVIPIHSDARCLRLPDNFVDGVFSSGSIEHFGSVDAVIESLREIARVLKPTGVASIATEFRIDGPQDRAWFDDNCILFTPELLASVLSGSGLELVTALTVHQSEGTFRHQKDLVEFLSLARSVRSLPDKQAAYPNLILFHEGFLFCSVHLLLRRSSTSTAPRGAESKFWAEIKMNEEALASRLAHFQRPASPIAEIEVLAPSQLISDSESTTSAGAVGLDGAARIAELEHILNAVYASNSWRITKPLRAMMSLGKRLLKNQS